MNTEIDMKEIGIRNKYRELLKRKKRLLRELDECERRIDDFTKHPEYYIDI